MNSNNYNINVIKVDKNRTPSYIEEYSEIELENQNINGT